MAEQESFEDEEVRIDGGAEPRDLSERSTWRERTDPAVLQTLDLYGTYLTGQTDGLSEALSLPAVAAVLEIEDIDQAERPETTRRLLLIHARVMEIARMRRRKAAHHG